MIDTIQLRHGSGSSQQELLAEVIIPALGGGGTLEDAAVFELPPGRIAFTTDSFVVKPLVFPGGDIGKLAACGTINDLSMMGARPHSISVALILEEGLDAALLRRLLLSLRKECEDIGVTIRCGDTKVVERGKADGVYMTTTGIGVIGPGKAISAAYARPGDSVLVSGPIGLHGIAITAARENLNFASEAISDCAALWPLVEILLEAAPGTRALRDATRGGCAAVLNEIALASGVTIVLDQQAIPVPAVVEGACSFLGIDPLHVANEGRCVAVVPAHESQAALNALVNHELGKGASIIGTVREQGKFPVLLKTVIGGTRVVDFPPGELLPRIC